MRVIATTLLISVVLLAAGCGSGDAEKEVAKRLESKGTAELMEEASDDEYSPPSDNLLTEAHVETYLAVRDREAKIAEVSRKQMEQHAQDADGASTGIGGAIAGFKSLGAAADLVTADIRAAQELGYNTAEYQWIKERVLEASGYALTEQMNQQISASLDAQRAQMETALGQARTDEERAYLEEALKGIEESRASASAEATDPWVVPNRELLGKYENALKALEMEMAKYSDSAVRLGIDEQDETGTTDTEAADTDGPDTEAMETDETDTEETDTDAPETDDSGEESQE